jgi:hypothetical protein
MRNLLKSDVLFLPKSKTGILFLLLHVLVFQVITLFAQESEGKKGTPPLSYGPRLIKVNQETEDLAILLSKPHFEIILLHDSIDPSLYYSALSTFQYLDKYRSRHQRRTIAFSDGKAKVVLYSSDELKEKYGRPIGPMVPLSDDLIPEVEFYLTLQGKIKEVVK